MALRYSESALLDLVNAVQHAEADDDNDDIRQLEECVPGKSRPGSVADNLRASR